MKAHAQTANDTALKQPIIDYFYGTYEADEHKIRNAFHKDAKITGFFDGNYVEWSVDEFIERITNQKSAKDAGEAFEKKIVSYAQFEEIAYVIAEAPAFGHYFTDVISLVHTPDGWKIRHKQFTNAILD